MEDVSISDPDSDSNNESLIKSFREITSSSKEEAFFYMDSHNYDLAAAVSTFFDNNNINDDDNNGDNPGTNVVINDNTNDVVSHPTLPSPDSHSPSRSRSASPTPSRRPYELRSRRALGKAATTKPSGSRTGRIRTLSDLRQPSRDTSDSDSDETQEYYTGGQKRYYYCFNSLSSISNFTDFFLGF